MIIAFLEVLRLYGRHKVYAVNCRVIPLFNGGLVYTLYLTAAIHGLLPLGFQFKEILG